MGTFLLSKMSLNVIIVKLFCISINQFLKNLCSGTHRGGFQFLLILELWGISHLVQKCNMYGKIQTPDNLVGFYGNATKNSFHVLVVFGLGKDLLFKYVCGHCARKICNFLKSEIFSKLFLSHIGKNI